MVPTNLNDDRKARRNEVSAEILEWLETGPDFLNLVKTDDVSRFLEKDWNREADCGMAHTTFSKTEESSHAEMKIQENGHYFLLLSRSSS
jgi:hypothetical protein